MTDIQILTTSKGAGGPRRMAVRDRGGDTFEPWAGGTFRVMQRSPELEFPGSGPRYSPTVIRSYTLADGAA